VDWNTAVVLYFGETNPNVVITYIKFFVNIQFESWSSNQAVH